MKSKNSAAQKQITTTLRQLEKDVQQLQAVQILQLIALEALAADRVPGFVSTLDALEGS